MAQPIPLRTLLQQGFRALMTGDEMYALARYPTTAFGESPQRSDQSVLVIRADTVEAKDWLLATYIDSLPSLDRRALLVTANTRVHLLGHALLASAVGPASLGQGYLEDEDWHRVSSLIQRIRGVELSLMIKGRRSAGAFSQHVEQYVRETATQVLLIDEPSRCFPQRRQDAGMSREGVPAAILALVGTVLSQIIVVTSDVS